MAKIPNGAATIAYGTVLPTPSTSYDGALFFKTASTGTGLNAPSPGDGPQGLYVFAFVKDNDPAVFGNQGAHAWVKSASGGGVDADTLNGLPSSAFQPVNAELTALANTTTSGIYVRTGTGTSITRTIVPTSTRIGITNGNGVSGNPSIDVIEANLNLANMGGSVTVAKGGTGATTLTGYLKGNGTSAFTAVSTIPAADIAAGTAPINITGNAGTATSAASANTSLLLTNARTITLSGQVTGSASFNGGADINIVCTLAGVSGAYVSRSGDTMSGNLVVNGISLVYSSSTVQAATFTGAGASVGYARMVRGDATHTGYMEMFNAAGTRQGYMGYTADAGGAVRYVSEVAGAHSFAGTITSDGDITAFSDIRLKTNIEIITDPLAKIQQLRGVNFTRIANGQAGTGLIAQDVQAVLPQAVIEHAEDEGMLSVAYGNLVGLLVEGMKAQQQQIDDLRSEIASIRRTKLA